MADFSALKTAIQTYIKQNGNEEITGDILQEILLSVVTTLGDSAINDLVTALANEVASRQNADGTLQQNITNEATARGNADTALGGRIDDEATARANGDTALSNRLGSSITAENTAADQIGAEAEARAAADTALLELIDGITDNIENGYVYAGIATPSSTPASGKVFYLALTAGTYTNFGSTEVSQGINILKYNGSAWSLDAFIGIDDELTPGSNNIPKSGNVLENIIKNGSAFDLSAYNAVDGVLATYADLDAALTALNDLPAVYKQGGMSFRFVRTSDNNYQQWRYMGTAVTGSPNPFLDTNNWQRDVTEIKDNSYLLSTIENTNGYVFEAIDKYGNKRLFIDVILYKRLILNGKDVNESIQEIHDSIEDLNSKIYFDSEHETYPSIITEVKPDASLSEIYVDQDDYVCEYIKKDGTKGIAKLLVDYEECYNLIAKYINGKKIINHTGEKLIGCAYFDGWSGAFRAWRNDSIDKAAFAAMSQQSLSEETGSAIDKNQYLDDWREYYYAVYGNYPPQDASVCTSFPKSAPVVIPTRKPMWGWLRKPTTADVYEGNDINKMYYTIDDEIDLASEYGIDYFLFCFYIEDYYPETNPVFDENDNLVDSVVRTSMGNEAVYGFFSSANRHKMKGAIMICDHQHVITNAKRAWSVNKYIYDNFISDPSYLYFNGRPVVAYYDDPAIINNSIRIKDTLYLHARVYNSEMDGLFAYASYGFWLTANTPYSTFMNDVDMTNKNYCYYSDAPVKIYSVMSGRDNRARNEFTTTDYAVPPTSDEFKEALRKAIRLSNKSEGMKTILIYGWNEYTEGGWLVPSESEVTTVPNDYPTGKYDGTPQRMDGSGNLLYYNFFKLQAIKELKEEWLNNKI